MYPEQDTTSVPSRVQLLKVTLALLVPIKPPAFPLYEELVVFFDTNCTLEPLTDESVTEIVPFIIQPINPPVAAL